jgi:hypothetical protein
MIEMSEQAQEQAQTSNRVRSMRTNPGGHLQRGNRTERATGLEPATSSLGSWHSTN